MCNHHSGEGWIIADQGPAMVNYSWAVWVLRCLRCKAEEPAFPGSLDDVTKQGERFIKLHKLCTASD
jgi:hypothetical protein